MLDFFIQWILFAAIIIDASIAWFVLLKNPKRSVNQAYWMMMTAIAVWQISNFLFCYYPFQSKSTVSFILALTYPAAGLAVYLSWYFFVLFPKNEHKPKSLFFIFVFWICAGIIINSTNWLVELIGYSSVGKNSFTYHWLYAPFAVSICIGIIGIFCTLYKKYKYPAFQREKLQVQYLMIGFGIASAIALTTNLIVPIIRNVFLGISLEDGPYIYNIGPAASVIFSLFVAYAILRHRLLAIKLILQRKWFSVILTISLIAIATGISFFADDIRIPIITLCVGLLLYTPLQRGITVLIRQIIKKEFIDLFKLTDVEKKFLATCQTPTAFFRHLTGQIMQRIPLEQLQCFVYDHKAKCFTTAFAIGKHPHMPNTLHCNEYWFEPFTRNKGIFRPNGEDFSDWSPEDRKFLEAFCKEKNIHMLIPIFDRDRLFGMYIIGNRIDLQPLGDEDTIFLSDVQKTSNSMIFSILNLYHVVSENIDDSERVEELMNPEYKKRSRSSSHEDEDDEWEDDELDEEHDNEKKTDGPPPGASALEHAEWRRVKMAEAANVCICTGTCDTCGRKKGERVCFD